jgi:hypothetical protein
VTSAISLRQTDRLRHLIRELQRMQFGRRSEKLNPDRLALGLEDLEQALAAAEAEAEKTDPTLRRARARSGVLAAARCRTICRGSRSSSATSGLSIAWAAITSKGATATASTPVFADAGYNLGLLLCWLETLLRALIAALSLTPHTAQFR